LDTFLVFVNKSKHYCCKW